MGLAFELRHLNPVKAQAAMEKIYQIYQGQLYLIAVRILKDTSEAEEVVNDAFVKIWKKRADINDDQHLAALLRIALLNTALDARRKLDREKKIPVNVKDDSEQAEVINLLQTSDILRRVGSIIDTMPKQRGEIFRLYLKGKTNNEIAADLGTTSKTVKTQIARAKQTIEDKLLNSPDRDAYLMLLFFCYAGSTFSA